MADIPTNIGYAEVSQVLASDDSLNQTLFLGNSIVKRTPRLIYIVRKAIQFEYANYPTSPTLIPLVNYLISLCGKYLVQAQQIFGNATGTVVPTGTIPSIPVNYPYTLVFTVTSGQAGVNTYQDNNLIGSLGWNTIFINNGAFQLGSGFTVNSSTGTITFVNYTLQTGDEVTGLYFKTF